MKAKPVLLLINPNTSVATTKMMHRILGEALPAWITVRSATAAQGAPMITNEAEMRVAVDEVVAIGQQRAADVAAIIIGAFGNPGLEPLRRVVEIPVIGIGEAAMREAAFGGRRFGVATTTPGLDASIAASADRLGLAGLFTGTRVSAEDPRALAADPPLQEMRLAELVRACIEDGASAVVIGGGPLAEAAARLAPRFGVPVISPVSAAAREAELLMHTR